MRITAGFLLLSGGTALAFNDLGAVIGLIGSTGATLLGLVTPAAAYLVLAARADGEGKAPFSGGAHVFVLPSSLPAAVLRGVALLVLSLGLLVLPSRLFCS